MGLGPLAGTTWGSIVTVMGTAALFLAAAVGAIYIAGCVAGYVVLSLVGLL
jgi:hypothetical protein